MPRTRTKKHVHRNIEVRIVGVLDDIYTLDPGTCSLEVDTDLSDHQRLAVVKCEDCGVEFEFEWDEWDSADLPPWARAAVEIVRKDRGDDVGDEED